MSKAQEVINLLEEVESDADKLASDIKKEITSLFPDSYLVVKFSKGLAESVDIFFALGKDKSEWSNGIVHNDPAYTIMHIYGMNRDGSINKPLELKGNLVGSIKVKSEDRMYAFGRVKVPFRKTTGDTAAIIKAVKTYFERLKKTLQDNKDKIPENDLKLIGNKF